MPELSVEITGSADKLEKALNDSKKGLKSFEKDTNNFQKKFNKNTSAATKSVKGFQKGVGQGQSALTSFSRVVQDAPYGMNAIANNITNLTEQFGYLKNRTGSARGALNAMLKDLKGFGGITLAISLATSLWVAFGDKITKTTEKVNELTNARKDLIGSANVEIDRLKILLKISKDKNNSDRERELALKTINKEYGKYLPNLTKENVSSQEVTDSVNNLTTAYIRNAKIKGLQSRISALYAKQYEIENKSLSDQLGYFEKLWISIKNYGDTGKAALEGVEKANENQKESLKETREELTKLSAALSGLLKQDIKLGGVNTDSLVPEKTVKRLKLAFVGIKKTWREEADDGYSNFLDATDNFSKSWLEKVNNILGIVIKTPKIDGTPTTDGLSDLELRLLEFSERSSQIIQGSIMQTFNQLGEGIGNALANGGNILESIGLSLLNSMGQFLSKMGGLLIQYGVMAKLKGKLDLAIAKGGPFAIAAGTAAIAAGIALKAIGGAISRGATGGFSSGGSVNSGASTYSSSSGGAFSGATTGTGLQNIVFEIQGTKLVGVLNNTLRRNSALGGTLTIGG